MENVALEYIASNNNGLIGVASKISNESDWNKEFVLFSISDSFVVNTRKLNFELNKNTWRRGQK